MARRLTLCGQRPISLAVDVTNYVMLELGRPIHGYDADKLPGAIRVRRARDGERLTTLDGNDRALSTEDLVVTDDSGIIGLGGVMGGETTEMSATHDTRAGRGRALGRRRRCSAPASATSSPPRPASATSVASTRSSAQAAAAPGRRAARGVRRRHDRARRDRRRRRRRRAARSRSRSTCPHGSPAWTSPSHTTVANLEAVGCAVSADGGHARRDVPRLAPRPQRPLRPRRGGRPDRRLRPRARRCCPTRPPGRGLTREQRLRRRVGRTLAGAGLRRGAQLPVRRPAPTFDPLGLPTATTCAVRRVRLANPLSQRGAVVHHHAAARPAPAARPQPRPRRPRRGAVRDRHRRLPASTGVRRRSTASTGGPPTTSWPS